MRRLLPPLLAVALLIAACGSGSSTSTLTTSAPANSTTTEPKVDGTTSESVTSESVTSESVTSESVTLESVTSESVTKAATTESLTSAAVAAPGTVIATAPSEFGQILFDGNQQAIYLFDKETSSTPECYDDCAIAWPPVLTTGAPVATGGIDAALLGVTERTDGTTQVTYGGHPLYYYVDEGPGEVKCHNVPGFGGLWLVVTPAGEAAAV